MASERLWRGVDVATGAAQLVLLGAAGYGVYWILSGGLKRALFGATKGDPDYDPTENTFYNRWRTIFDNPTREELEKYALPANLPKTLEEWNKVYDNHIKNPNVPVSPIMKLARLQDLDKAYKEGTGAISNEEFKQILDTFYRTHKGKTLGQLFDEYGAKIGFNYSTRGNFLSLLIHGADYYANKHLGMSYEYQEMLQDPLGALKTKSKYISIL